MRIGSRTATHRGARWSWVVSSAIVWRSHRVVEAHWILTVASNIWMVLARKILLSTLPVRIRREILTVAANICVVLTRTVDIMGRSAATKGGKDRVWRNGTPRGRAESTRRAMLALDCSRKILSWHFASNQWKLEVTSGGRVGGTLLVFRRRHQRANFLRVRFVVLARSFLLALRNLAARTAVVFCRVGIQMAHAAIPRAIKYLAEVFVVLDLLAALVAAERSTARACHLVAAFLLEEGHLAARTFANDGVCHGIGDAIAGVRLAFVVFLGLYLLARLVLVKVGGFATVAAVGVATLRALHNAVVRWQNAN